MSRQSTNAEKNMKIVLFGAGGVGKTNLISRMSSGVFERRYIPTSGTNSRILDSSGEGFNSNKARERRLCLHFWDTPGQEFSVPSTTSDHFRFHPPLLTDATCLLLCFDLQNRLSYEHVKDWERFLKVNSTATILLVGLKSDLPGKVERPCEYKVSAKTGDGLEDLLNTIMGI